MFILYRLNQTKIFILSNSQVHDIDAIHPGYGFLSENHNFAAACEANGITFIGPKATVMAKMGDKVSARESALNAGLPIIPGTDTALSDAQVSCRFIYFYSARKGAPLLVIYNIKIHNYCTKKNT